MKPRNCPQRVIGVAATADLQNAGRIVTALAQLRRDGAHCDVLLQAENAASNGVGEVSEVAGEARGVWAHRAVLAAASPYFYAMFSSSFQECSRLIVVIKNVKLEILRALIENIYFPTSLVVTVDKALAMLAAATMLNVVDVREAAAELLTAALTVDNVLSIHASAQLHACTALSKAAMEYIHEHAERVLAGNELLEISPESLVKLLDNERLPASEELVLDAVLRWTKHCHQNMYQKRRQYLSSLLRAVRLPLVPRSVLVERARAEPLVNTEPKALLQIIEALAIDRERTELQAYNTQPPATLFVIGGISDDYTNSDTLICSLRRGRWQSGKSLPTPCSRAGAALLDNRVYLVGGWDGSSPVRTVFVYDAASDSWSSGPLLNRARRWLGVTTLNGRVYAAGGWDDAIPGLRRLVSDTVTVSISLNSVEALDPREGVWRYVASMPTRRRSIDMATLDGKLYAVGGCDSWNSLNITERYDPTANRWERVEALKERRQNVGVGVIDDSIYAVAGYDGTSPLQTVERYSVSSGWEYSPTLPSARRSSAVTAYGGKLYVVGGSDGTNPLSNVSVFDPTTDVWRELPTLPVGRYMAAAVVVPWSLPDS